jgi:hypothetical protein
MRFLITGFALHSMNSGINSSKATQPAATEVPAQVEIIDTDPKFASL